MGLLRRAGLSGRQRARLTGILQERGPQDLIQDPGAV